MFMYVDDFDARIGLHYQDYGIAAVSRDFRNLDAGTKTTIKVTLKQVCFAYQVSLRYLALIISGIFSIPIGSGHGSLMTHCRSTDKSR